MKTITTFFLFVFVFSSFSISAQDQPDQQPEQSRWELVLSSNARFRHSDGEQDFSGRNALQFGYHLNRVLIAGVESSLTSNGKSVSTQAYLKFRKSIADDFFWYVQGDAGYQWAEVTRSEYAFIDGEIVTLSVREERRDRFRSDFTFGFEYLFAKQWSALASLNFMEGIGLGIRHNF